MKSETPFFILIALMVHATMALTLDFGDTAIDVEDKPVAQFAAKELNAIVSKSTGRKFAVISKQQPVSIIHKRTIVIKSDAKYDYEESAVFEQDGNLHLEGGELGVLWAVYDFCEDQLGFRQYLDREDGAFIEKRDVITYEGKETRRKPHFLRRSVGEVNKLDDRTVARIRNRQTDCLGRIIPGFHYRYQSGVWGHGFEFFLPSGKKSDLHRWSIPKDLEAEYECFTTHPEWFSMMADGTRNGDHQLCFSNRGCRDALTRMVLGYMKARGPGFYQVGVNDARFGHLCWCDECAKLEKKYNTYGGPLWDYIVELCGKVKETFPEGGYYVQSLAYDGLDQTEKAPDNIVFPDNFVVDIAYIHVPDRAISELPDKRAPEGEMVNYYENTKKWHQITSNRSYWFYGTSNPSMIYRRMQREMKEIASPEIDVRYVFMCGTGGGYEFGDITRMAGLRLMYDPDCDIRAWIESAVKFKYGPAAPELMKYMDELETRAASVIASSKGGVFDCGMHMYENMSFLTGRELVAWRKLFEVATEKVNGNEFYEKNIAWARIGLDLWSVIYAKRIRTEVPDYPFDEEKVKESAIAAAKDYGERFLRKGQKNHALTILEQIDRELAYYSELKDDRFPEDFALMQPDFVTRILPYKTGRYCEGKVWSEDDPDAACGHAIVDRLNSKADLTKPIPVYLYDYASGRHLMAGATIDLSRLKSDGYTLFKLGRSTIPANSSLIIAEAWATPFAANYLTRVHNPSYPKREYDIYLSAKYKDGRLYIDQIFTYQIVGSGN